MSQTLFAVWSPVHYADRNPGVSDLIGNEQLLFLPITVEN